MSSSWKLAFLVMNGALFSWSLYYYFQNMPPYLPREDGFSSLDTHFSLDNVSDIVQVSSLEESREVKSVEGIHGEPTEEQLETLRKVDKYAKTKYGMRMCRMFWADLGKNRINSMDPGVFRQVFGERIRSRTIFRFGIHAPLGARWNQFLRKEARVQGKGGQVKHEGKKPRV